MIHTIRASSLASVGHQFLIGTNTASTGILTGVTSQLTVTHTGTAGYT